jgi:hypothetical protein
VPPGHYKAFAWEKIYEDAYGDPDFLKPFESLGESFDIAATEQKSVQLKVIGNLRPESEPPKRPTREDHLCSSQHRSAFQYCCCR